MRAYIAATQAQATYYADRADEYARRGMPGIASDYRWLAANADRIVTLAAMSRPGSFGSRGRA